MIRELESPRIARCSVFKDRCPLTRGSPLVAGRRFKGDQRVYPRWGQFRKASGPHGHGKCSRRRTQAPAQASRRREAALADLEHRCRRRSARAGRASPDATARRRASRRPARSAAAPRSRRARTRPRSAPAGGPSPSPSARARPTGMSSGTLAALVDLVEARLGRRRPRRRRGSDRRAGARARAWPRSAWRRRVELLAEQQQVVLAHDRRRGCSSASRTSPRAGR